MAAATFTFRAVDLAGVPQKGTLEAPDKQAVTEELKQRGWVVVDIQEKRTGLSRDIEMFNRVKPAELTIFTRQLSTMISSGMTLLRACYVLEEQAQNKLLKNAIAQVRDDIEAGLQFSDALDRHPPIFNSLYIAMVRAGEAGGVLEQSLIRVADQLEKDDTLRRQVKAAMIYPVVVLSFAVLVLLGLVAFIVPTFVGVFKDFHAELPLITKFTMSLSKFVTGRWYVLIVLVVGTVVSFRYWKGSDWGRPQWDRVRLLVPFKIGDTAKKIALARWSRTLAALYGAGVPIMQAIEVTGETSGNYLVNRAMGDVLASIRAGGTIAAPLKDAPVFPGMVHQMVAVGEESGNLDVMLAKIADFYEDEVAAAIKGLTSLLEPIMIIVIGGIVGFIVIAMYMPLFKVYDAIK